jgi:hypothetical protein
LTKMPGNAWNQLMFLQRCLEKSGTSSCFDKDAWKSLEPVHVLTMMPGKAWNQLITSFKMVAISSSSVNIHYMIILWLYIYCTPWQWCFDLFTQSVRYGLS